MIPPIVAATGPPVNLDLPLGWSLALALFLVGLNGFFVAAEFALVKVRPTQVAPHQDTLRGRLAQRMIDQLDAYLSATQLGITLASIGLGIVGEPAVNRLLQPLFDLAPNLPEEAAHSISLMVSFAIISMFHIVLGELAPKSLAIRRPEPTSLWVAAPLWFFYQVTYPGIWVLNQMANAFLRLFGIEPLRHGELAHSEEEIRSLLASEQETELSEPKRELLDNVFELSDRNARQVMVPRTEVVYLDAEAPMEANLNRARRSGHTRFPLCEGDLDQLVGLVHIKDLFIAQEPPESLREIARETFAVPETLPLDQLMTRMRHEHIHMAAVVDEFGGVAGIVTLENVLEEIVGEIQDEFDAEAPEFVRLDDGGYKVLGGMLLDDLEDELGMDISDAREEDTVAGIALSELGRTAEIGDTVEVGRLRLEVVEVDGNRIVSLRLHVLPEPPEDDA
ncbi:MAG: HlyC/CorC family transporter [Holophagales bacterium]|nr:HlyC/CorC family transporter [Holophagales bacterium]